MKEQTNNPERLKIAAQVAQGLLASQDKEKGWNIATLSVISLKIADAMLHYHAQETLPEVGPPAEEQA